MYKSFYHLTRNPFDLTPDPSFLFPTKGHNEALAALEYAVKWRKGFVVLTGEVGTGKTLMLRCFLKQLKQHNDVAYAYVFNSHLSPTDFLLYVATDLGLQPAGKRKSEVLFDLCHFVVERGMNKLNTVLIVDEAHYLALETLEEIRLLTNLETTDEKLLQIVLVGQPELDDKLESAQLRQLKQRISVRTQLQPLTAEETTQYIARRLEVAGASPEIHLFPSEASNLVYRYSRGIPRLINALCEKSLISAYARGEMSVSPEIVEKAAQYFRLVDLSCPTEPPADDFADQKRAAQVLLDALAAFQRVHNDLSPRAVRGDKA